MERNDPSGWATSADIATTVGTVVALIGVAVTAFLSLRSEGLTRRGQQLERDQAEATAARAEAAASLTEMYTQRVVDALETMAAATAASIGAGDVKDVGPKRARWSLEWSSGATYILKNVGNLTARTVRVSAHPTLRLGDLEPRDIGPNEAATFMASRSFGTRDSTITVEWQEDGSGQHTWRYPLPPRPKG